MADSDSDEDLKRAIQLSMQSVEPQVKASGVQVQSNNIINLDSDDESTTDESDTEIRGPDKNLPKPEAVSIGVSTGMLGLDRKAMEQERLARKRKASISLPPPRKVPRHNDSTSKVSTSDSAAEKVLPNKQSTSHALPSLSYPSSLPFPNGAVKKTWLFGYPRQGEDMKIEEILQKNDLALAVLSSFQWDVEWLLRKLNAKTTQLVFVMQADTADTKAQYRQETASMPNLRLCFPSMEGQINCMHSKLMLLSYPSHLRIVVPTANLVPYDWGETGVMENMVFLIDLARLPTPLPMSQQKMTDFGDDLIYFLQAMGLDQSIIDSLYHFDFSATRDLAFVHTIGGAHTGDDEPWRRTGYCGLGRAISRLGLASNDHQALEIDYVTSSIGSLNLEFLSTLYLAARGDGGTKEYEQRNVTLGKRAKDYSTQMKRKTDTQEKLRKEIDEGFRIYFPSQDTVEASKGGPGCGGTICFQRKWWESSTFPRQLMRDCKSRRGGALMHNKIIYVHPSPSPSPSPTTQSTPYAYIGSANCSESAWGNRLVKDRASKLPKLNCRNWECGVVVPLRPRAGTTTTSPTSPTSTTSTKTSNKKHKHNSENEEVTTKENEEEEEEEEEAETEEGLWWRRGEEVVPVPMEVPGEKFDETGRRKPWFYMDG